MADSVKNETGKKSIKKIILFALVLAIAVVAFFAYSYLTKSFIFKGESEDEKTITQVYALDEFVVNLKDPVSKRYLKTKIALGIENEKDIELLEENQMHIRDVIIQTLRSKTTDEIMAVEKTEDLRNELMGDVNKLFNDNIVLDVYMVDFLIQ